MAVMSRSNRLAALLVLLALAASAAAKTTQDAAAADAAVGKEDETWTGWAKEKISEGLGLKHLDEEEAARKAGETAKSTRETAQHAASGTYASRPCSSLRTLPCYFLAYSGTDAIRLI
jgi:Spy/CpxP family protein refolding chaperone